MMYQLLGVQKCKRCNHSLQGDYSLTKETDMKTSSSTMPRNITAMSKVQVGSKEEAMNAGKQKGIMDVLEIKNATGKAR